METMYFLGIDLPPLIENVSNIRTPIKHDDDKNSITPYLLLRDIFSTFKRYHMMTHAFLKSQELVLVTDVIQTLRITLIIMTFPGHREQSLKFQGVSFN